MGMFNFWKKKTNESINFSKLDEWLELKLQEKKLNKLLEEFNKNISQVISSVQSKLSDLEKAELQNDAIPIKEKQIMEGHRKIYIQRVKKFVEEIKCPTEFSQAGHLSAQLSENISKLINEINRNQMVLSNFFKDNISQINSSIKTIEILFSKLQSDVEKANVETFREAKIKLKQYNEEIAKKERLEAEQNKLYSDSDLLRKKKSRIEAKLEELKKSPEYSLVKDLFDTKKKNEEELAKIEQELSTEFVNLNRPLKKYTYNKPNEKFADKYLSDPYGSLQDDQNLLIIDILASLFKDIENMDINEKQINNAKSSMEKLTKEYLEQIKLKILQMKSANKEIATKINKNIVTLNIAENESWIKSLESKIHEIEKQISHIKKSSEEINLDYLKQKVKEKFKEIDPTINIEETN